MLDERVLGVVDQDDPLGAERRDLAAELRADRAAGAGDEHGLAGDVGGDRRDVELDGLAPEDVLDLDLAELAREVEVAGDQLVDARQRLHGDAGVAAGVDDPLARLAGADGIAMITSSGRLSTSSRGSSVGRAQHADAVQAHVLLARHRRRRARSACSRAAGSSASRG